MNKCKKCPSFALNLWQQGVDTRGLCDLCYYKGENRRLRARLRIKEKDYELLSEAFNATCDYVVRLRGTIKTAEWEGDFCDAPACPWCLSRVHEKRHNATCPAFDLEGNVR